MPKMHPIHKLTNYLCCSHILSLQQKEASQALVGHLLPMVMTKLGQHNPQGLSNMIHGLASVGAPEGVDATVAVGKFASSLCGRLGEFRPQEIANSLSGLAKLGARLDGRDGSGRVQCPGLANEIQDVVVRRLTEYTPQNLANVAWATAKLLEKTMRQEDRDALNFWALFATAVQSRAHEFNARELSMCVWAASKGVSYAAVSKEVVTSFISAVAAAASGLADKMDAQQVATITLALCKLGCQDRDLLKKMQKVALHCMDDCNPQDLVSRTEYHAHTQMKRSESVGW